MLFPRPSSPAAETTGCASNGSGRAAPAVSEGYLPMTPAQRRLAGGEAAPDVARHWEQAVWDNFSLARLRQAVAQIAQRYPLTRATRMGMYDQGFDGPVPDTMVRVTEASTLEPEERRRALANERANLCLAANGNPAPAWQVHVMLTGNNSAVLTVCFARLFFDRTTIRRILDELLDAVHGIAPSGPAGSLDAFSDYAAMITHRATVAPAHPPTEIPAGPEWPQVSTASTSADARCTRLSIRLDADTWANLKSNLLVHAGRAATAEALVGTACGSVLAGWSRARQFGLQVTREARGPHGTPLEAAGQFCEIVTATIDDAGERPFLERVFALQTSLTAASLSYGYGSDAAAVVAVPPVGFAWWSAPRPGPEPRAPRSDHFVFVGASRPGVVLEFNAEETAAGAMFVHLDYVPSAFPAGMIEGLVESLEAWLRALASDPAAWRLRPAAQAERIFPAAQRERRRAVNATAVPRSDELLFSGFLQQLSAAPDRIAVITPDRTLTYGEVYGYACSLAHELHRSGVRRNELVAIAADKGWEQIVAALGITLAGAAYLPVEVDLPAERFRFLLEYGEARFVVTQSLHLATLPAPDAVARIALDRLTPVSVETPPPDVVVAAGDLAYVIFTSGSTGTPKGVMIDHRGAVNTIIDMNTRFGVQATDRVLALSRLSFDLSVYDIFGLLAAGGAIVVPAPELVRDPAHWAALVRDHGVTIWDTVPALMQLLVDYAADGPASLGSSLRLVWMSGDWIPLTLPGRIEAALPGAEIVSLGGATEASIWSILFPITSVDATWRSIPYGRPMENQTFHVLHETMAPCPEYVTGELYIGGRGVALGYWKDPVRTDARFVPHPSTGERLYRTGDLGRFLPDGNIEFLGRADFQVKIRGFRIELGEIESALAAHQQVRAAVVVARGETDSNRQLVAYVVPATSAPVAADELQDFLRTRLPDYMVPPVIMGLERLPLTANGKVDVKSLPAPAAGAGRPPHVEPTNELEEILVQIWRPLLGVERIGIHDNFFALGGNSLTGTRVIIRVREAFALPVPVQFLFTHPTISRLAGALEQLLLTDLASAEPPAPTPR